MGVAIVAPLAMPADEASAEELAFQSRIHQQFIPNVDAEMDLIFTDVEIDLSAAEQEREAAEKAAAEKAEAEKAAAEKTAAEKAAQGADAADVGAPPKYTGGGAPADWMSAAGISEGDWAYVDYIANRESGWNPNATNASSGACGLIQAYPCSKVPGSGYDPVDNLTWANGYAVDRYGSWAAAYDFWTANHWW